ncbi:MAG: RHS repeat-associated core domain-containing protein [Chthoniobacteraceae bacterium]
MPGYKYLYDYDGIGNRTSSSGGNDQTITYSTNSRNQYVQRTIPPWVDVVGTANSASAVSVNSAPAQRTGDWFYYGVPVKYSGTGLAAYLPITIGGERGNADGAGHAAWLVTSGHLLVPHGPEGFQYDNAGNLLHDGLWSYTWSSAGRLAEMDSLVGVPDGAKRKLTFAYDYLGRRVQKVVYQEPLTSTSSVAAFYSLTDNNTQGNWQGTYGQDGYYLYGDNTHSYSSAPSYATVTVTGGTAGTWAGSTTDPRAILPPGGGTGSAGRLYGGTLFIDVNITDGQSHWLSMYFLDWDVNQRQALVYVYDGGSAGTLLDTEPISAFYFGKYLTWGIRGHVKFVVKNMSLSNTNASISGLFFDSGERKLNDTRYVYDGWNVISELDGKNSNAVKRTEVWGLDASESLQGAGGVGGLLAVNESLPADAGTYLPCYDGNGNVVAMEKASDGSVAAQYEYGPFGEAIRGTGVYAANNPWRFSTKYSDAETGLLYYGYRYYAPVAGRWISRDPIAEKGGENLYCMLDNNLVNNQDYCGETSVTSILVNFFSPVGPEALWVMDEDDYYTFVVSHWTPPKVDVNRAMHLVSLNPFNWKKYHKTSPGWRPGNNENPDIAAGYFHNVQDPPGTDPVTAENDLLDYFYRSYTNMHLYVSAIGSYRIWATIDSMEGCKATLNVWMSNTMDRRSFGNAANDKRIRDYVKYSAMQPQHMWWNWKQEFTFNGQGGYDVDTSDNAYSP